MAVIWSTGFQGEGPIHLIGSHCIDFFDNMAGEADSEGEDEEMEASLVFVFLVGLRNHL